MDPAASVNVANAKQAGMIVHAYHFARFTSNASANDVAQWFDKMAQLVGFNKNTDGYVVCDGRQLISSVTLPNSQNR